MPKKLKILIKLTAKIENLKKLLNFLERLLFKKNISKSKRTEFLQATEEIFVNVVDYAYGKKIGKIIIEIFFEYKNEIKIKFVDSGMHFDPTRAPPPDISESAKKRKIGGWGIHIAKKLTDEMQYSRINGQNNLTITKIFATKGDNIMENRVIEETFKIEKIEENGTIKLKPQERIDTRTAPILQKSLEECFKNKIINIILDLENVEYMSSAGLRAILATQKKVEEISGATFQVINVLPEILNIFEMTGFNDILNITAK